MPSIETEHRGVKIRYSDNEDTWYCSELSFSHASLRRVKARIDKWWKDARSAAVVEVYRVSYDGTLRPAQVVEYLGDRHGIGRRGPQVAVVGQSYAKERPSRSEVSLSELTLATPALAALQTELTRLREQKKTIEDEITAKVNAIPRLSLGDIAELVKLRADPEPDELEAIPPGRPAKGPI